MSTKQMKILSTVFAMGLMAAGLSYAAGVGTTGAQFLKIATGARPAAMGGAFSAVADDINAIYWNPAGLAMQKEKQASASYVQYFEGVSIGFLGYSQPINNRGSFGAGLNYLSITDIARMTLADAADGTFGANDMALYLSYGDKELVKDLCVGANVKLIRQSIDAQSAQTFALDLSTLYHTPVENLTAALGVYNIGSGVKFVTVTDPLPLNVKLGLAYKAFNNKLLLAADVNDYINDERIYSAVGAEYTINSIICARGGYKIGTDSDRLGGNAGLSLGLGFKVWDVLLDYAFVPYGELNNTQQISISTKF